MPSDTTIGCSKKTLQLVKDSKEYPGQSLDELLRRTFGPDDRETEDRG